MVPGARLELALCHQNRILNPTRLPVPPPGRDSAQYTHRARCRKACLERRAGNALGRIVMKYDAAWRVRRGQPEWAAGQAPAIRRYFYLPGSFTWNNRAALAMPCLAAACPPVRRLIL